ncbi:MAG: MFS family permease [Verrucomicrobiales bacterium]|jgi:MFS family permease
MPDSTESQVPPKATLSELFSNRLFVRLFIAHTGSLLGTTLTMAALALLAEEMLGKGNGAALFGMALAIRIAVFVFLAPLAGNVAQKFGRRRVMIGTDLVRALVVVGFFFASATWQIYVLVLLLNAGAALFTPIYKSAIPGIVGERQYPRALALGSIAYKLSDVLGPVIASGVIVMAGYRSNFLIDVLTFVGSALLLLTIRIPEATTPAKNSGDVLFGMKQMLKRAGLRRSLALSLCESVVGAFVIIATASYVIGELGLAISMYPIAASASGIGAMIVAIAFSVWDREHVVPRFFAATSLTWLVAALVLAATLPFFAGLFVAWLCAGVGIAVLGIRSNEELAAHSEESERSHIFAAHFSLSHAGWGIFYPLAGFLSVRVGFQDAAWIFLGILAIVSLTLRVGRDSTGQASS